MAVALAGCLWLAMPLSWAVGRFEALHRYAVDGRFTFAGDLSSAGLDLGFAFMMFLAVPIVGFPFAVFGAIAGAALRDPRAIGTYGQRSTFG